jgi:hypothetical protein
MNDQTKHLTIYCLPISGGNFIGQLGLLSEIYECKQKISILNNEFFTYDKYAPNIIFGASGGNIAAYLALASDWQPLLIERIMYDLNSEMFFKSWLPKTLSFIPSFIIGAFMGTFYRQGDGCTKVLQKYFTSKSITRTEIWTGTSNCTHEKAQFFTNVSEQQSIISAERFNSKSSLYGTMELKFLDGDIEKISAVTVASAAIPLYTGKIEINDDYYDDGGTLYASPLPSMSSEIYHNVMTNNKKLRLFYITGHIMTCPKYTKSAAINVIEHIFYAKLLVDKNSAVELLYRIVGDKYLDIQHKIFNDFNTDDFTDLLVMLDSCQHYVLILSPGDNYEIVKSSYDPNTAIKLMKLSRKNYEIQLWYI